MVRGYEVLEMLIPDGGWVIYGNDYSGIQFLECNPIPEEEFIAGFDKVENWKIEQQKEINSKKSALLEKLGITEDEAQLLLS